MKPGKARKDRPKGAKTFARGSNKRVERSAVARPEKRDNRRDDKSDARKGFRKPVKVNDREVKREDRRGDRPEKRFDRRGATQDVVAGKNSVVEALRAKIPAKELVIAIKVELDEKISEAIRLAKNADLPIKEIPRRALDDLTGLRNPLRASLLSSRRLSLFSGRATTLRSTLLLLPRVKVLAPFGRSLRALFGFINNSTLDHWMYLLL